MTTNTTKAPALGRRALLHRALAGAAGAVIALPASAALAGAAVVDDPILALEAERLRLEAELATLDDAGLLDVEIERGIDARLIAVEDRMLVATPVSAGGAAVQMQLLRRFCDECEYNEVIDKGFGNVIAYLSRGGAA
jgi:hypothetical protein